MSQYKSIGGSGKKPYVWKDSAPSARRPAHSVHRTEVYAAPAARQRGYTKPAVAINTSKALEVILAVGLVVILFITVLSAIETSAENSKLESLRRKQQELTETLESTARTLDMEKRPQVICQLAEERLYMVRPGESIALNTFGRTDGQTAGR